MKTDVITHAVVADRLEKMAKALILIINDDPSLVGVDGFQPIRTRVGVAYEDDCLEINVTWRRDYVGTGDAEKGNTFQIHIAVKNLGF